MWILLDCVPLKDENRNADTTGCHVCLSSFLFSILSFLKEKDTDALCMSPLNFVINYRFSQNLEWTLWQPKPSQPLCFHFCIASLAVWQLFKLVGWPLLEASPGTITWSRPSKNEQAFIETFFLGGGFGCYLNCTQIFNLLFDAGNECAPKARHVRFGTEIDHKHIYRFSVRYCVCVQTWWLHETIRMPERFAVN